MYTPIYSRFRRKIDFISLPIIPTPRTRQPVVFSVSADDFTLSARKARFHYENNNLYNLYLYTVVASTLILYGCGRNRIISYRSAHRLHSAKGIITSCYCFLDPKKSFYIILCCSEEQDSRRVTRIARFNRYTLCGRVKCLK